jgi:hypothetical protein
MTEGPDFLSVINADSAYFISAINAVSLYFISAINGGNGASR